MKTYIGIDNGVTGAIAAIFPNESWSFAPVRVIDSGRDRLLDIPGNRQILDDLVQRAGGTDEVVVAYEISKKNPLFGAKGNFANGRNGEFWRVLLTLMGVPFCPADPQAWQRLMLQGIPGTDTKRKAALFIDQRFPRMDLSGFNAEQREAIRDAMCIALWARGQHR